MSRPDELAGSPDEGIPTLRMNLGIIIPSLEKYGGAERFVIECVRHWQHRHVITIYATAFNRDLLRTSGIGSSVKLIELSPSFEGEHAFLTNAVLLPKIWRQEIGRHDVYHTHLWPTHLVDLHPMVWFPHEPLRVVHDLRFEQRSAGGEDGARTVHVYPKYNYDQVGSDLYDAYLSAIQGMDRSVAPALTIANSRYTAGYLARIYDRDMPHVVYPGVDLEIPINLNVDPNLFVTISQLWPHKRTSLLIEAIALTDAIQLIVIGSGPELDRLKSLCIRLGVEDRVFFLTGLSHFEVRLVLARACAFLFCPIREPFGIVVLEAMAAGKPVVAVDEGGYVEICHPDFAMLIPASPLIFAEKIQYLRDNPDRVRMMGEAARKAVRPFTWKRTAAELERHLVDACLEVKSAPVSHPVQDGSRPLIGIQYYQWYGEGFGAQHWNDNPRQGHVGDHPFLGFYPSDMGQTIEHHISQFEAMKLDHVILNLQVDENGMNEIELRSIRNLFEIASRRQTRLRFAIQVSIFAGDAARVRSTVARIEELYAERDEYLRVDGKPALFWFWSSAYDGNRELFESLRQVAANFRNFAMSSRMAKGVEESRYTFGFFEGFGLYSPLEISSEENWGRAWQDAYDASATAGMSYRMATVSPGYDDHALMDATREGNPNRVVPRREGEVYARSLEFAASLSPPPHFIIVSTFNEYHENTHIEPSARNGDLYVRMTRDFVERMHGATSRGDADE